MTEELNYILIRNAIAGGAMDEALENLAQQIIRRRAVIAAKRAAKLTIGDQFYLVENIKPKLLGGALCTVTGFEGTRVKVTLMEDRSQKWRKGGQVRVPRTLIGEKAE